MKALAIVLLLLCGCASQPAKSQAVLKGGYTPPVIVTPVPRDPN